MDQLSEVPGSGGGLRWRRGSVLMDGNWVPIRANLGADGGGVRGDGGREVNSALTIGEGVHPFD